MPLKAQVLFEEAEVENPLKFLYPQVKEWFEGTWANGNEVLPCDLFARLSVCVEEYIEDSKYEVEPSNRDAARLRVCEEKMSVLSMPTAKIRKLYERELMQFCGLVMREAEIEIQNLGDTVMREAEIEREKLDDTMTFNHDEIPYCYREFDNID